MDDKRIYDAYLACRGSAALVVAVRLGLFPLLAEKPSTIDEVARALQVSVRGIRALVRALRGMGLLELGAAGYTLSADSARFLVPGQTGYLGGLIDADFDLWMTPAGLLDAVKQGRASIYGGEEVWAEHDRDPERAARFADMMTAISTRPAVALASSGLFAHRTRLLDVGAGAGIFALEALRVHPRLQATIFEIPGVIPLAREALTKAGFADRIEFVGGDMFKDVWPKGADIVLLSQILHDWTPEQGEVLLARAHEALEPGGIVVVHEKLLGADGGPMATALVDLDMLMWTEGQQLTQTELAQQLQTAGFQNVKTVATIGYWSATVAHKV